MIGQIDELVNDLMDGSMVELIRKNWDLENGKTLVS